MRYFYNGECEGASTSCNKLILKNIQIMKGYPAEFIFMTLDRRFLLSGMLKANKPMLYFQTYQGGRLLSDLMITLP